MMTNQGLNIHVADKFHFHPTKATLQKYCKFISENHYINIGFCQIIDL